MQSRPISGSKVMSRSRFLTQMGCVVLLTLMTAVVKGEESKRESEARETVRLSHPQHLLFETVELKPTDGAITVRIDIDRIGDVQEVVIVKNADDAELELLIVDRVRLWRVDLQDAPRASRSVVRITYEVRAPKTVIVRSSTEKRIDIDEDRHLHSVSEKQISERIVQSTPDALTFASGVFIQRTAHGQASPYIRGRTGQQTLILVDGLRLNHALFRKGPNQYLFTIDPHTLSTIEVLRGSAGVEYGGDAIGGAVFLHPKEPRLDPTQNNLKWSGRQLIQMRSADRGRLARSELTLQTNQNWALMLGIGGGIAEELESGGRSTPKEGAQDLFCDSILSVPCFRSDGKTQVGTGYKHLTADAQVKMKDANESFKSAVYVFRQYDAPRTDQCPSPEAAIGECLIIEEQFRTHAFIKYDRELGFATLERLSAASSFQRQHQKYLLTRPDRNPTDGIDTTTHNGGQDRVDGFAGFLRGQSRPLRIGDAVLDARYGIDGNAETIESDKYIEFAEPPTRVVLSRGQYIAGSRYLQGGIFFAPSLRWAEWRLRSGFRQALVRAVSEGDRESGSVPFDITFTPAVWNLGLSWGREIQLFGSLEQGFRAPNLDDLTARQSTGQGYQLENANLKSEIATTVEVGVKFNTRRLKGAFFVYNQRLKNAMERRLLTRTECTVSNGYTDRACRSNRAPLQLVNLEGTAEVYGAEAELRARIAQSLALRLSAAYAFGEGPHPNPELDDQVPLSRIPPLNGTGELIWRQDGFFVTAATRWSKAQDRLSIGDIADARIPAGGTPGYLVFDLRTGLRVSNRTYLNAVLENLMDRRYRSHGSGIYGAGRSLNVQISVEY